MDKPRSYLGSKGVTRPEVGDTREGCGPCLRPHSCFSDMQMAGLRHVKNLTWAAGLASQGLRLPKASHGAQEVSTLATERAAPGTFRRAGRAAVARALAAALSLPGIC